MTQLTPQEQAAADAVAVHIRNWPNVTPTQQETIYASIRNLADSEGWDDLLASEHATNLAREILKAERELGL